MEIRTLYRRRRQLSATPGSRDSFIPVLVVGDRAALLAGFAEQAGLGAGVGLVALDLLLGLRGVARERDGEQALLGDRLRRDLADPVGAVAHALDRGLDLRERLLLAGDQAEREVAVERVRAGVRHVLAVGGKVPGVL